MCRVPVGVVIMPDEEEEGGRFDVEVVEGGFGGGIFVAGQCRL